MTDARLAALKRRNKYGAVRCEADGLQFDSLAERARYHTLKIKQDRGEIVGLTVHPRYDLKLNGVDLGHYTADFRYSLTIGFGPIIEDVKSKPTMTASYRQKKKLMLALHGITIQEVFG